MLGHVTKITSSLYKIPIQSYSKFTVTAHESGCDTSKTGHPGLLKQECGTSVCNEKNCTKDVSECDPNTLKTFRVGHKANSVSGVETDKKVYQLENDPGSRGTPAKTVIYPEKEPVENNKFYDNLYYKETQVMQKDVNTQKLNEATKDLREIKYNKQDDQE